MCGLSKQRVGSNGETVIDIGIDSCAAASVIPRGLLQLPVRRDGRGGTYYTATKEQSQMRVCKSLKGVLMAMAPPWWDGFGLLLYLAR